MTQAFPVADRAQVRRATGELLRSDARAMVIVVGLYSLAALAGLAGPWLLGRIVDRVEAGTDVAGVDRLALAICGAVAVQVLLARTARYAGHRFGERALARLREEFVERTLALPISTVERAGTGELMTRSAVDVPTVGVTVADAVPEVFISVLQVLFILGAVFALDPLLGMCALTGSPLLWWVTRWYLRRARAAYLAEGAAVSQMSEVIATTTEGARTVEALGLGEWRVATGDARIAAAYATRVRTLGLRTVFFPVADTSHVLPVAATLLIGGAFLAEGLTSLGAVIAATLYLWQLVDPLSRVLFRVEQMQRGGASFARIVGLGAAHVAPPPRRGDATPVDDRLEVSAVRYAYDGGHDVLHGIDLQVRPGERLAVVGPSGAGKSTLGRLLAGIEAPRTGRITVGGVPVADLDPAERRRRVALVTQEHHVFLGSLRDNLAFAAPAAGDSEVFAALDAVGARWARDLPEGLDTEVGDGARHLDAAQAQQLALARLVLADPHTLILDEATAMLDPATARQTERSLAAVLDGRTVIAIAHRLNTAHDADRVAVLDGGVITELGSHDELIRAGGAYAALWQSWHG